MASSKIRFSKTYSAQVSGINADIITIEADISNGLHTFSIVGLGDRSVEESKDRISSAIKNSGYISPKQKNHKVVISLAPADIRKEGPVFDLGIALSYLLAAKEVRFDPEKKLFLGELSLEGNIRPIHGALAMVRAAQQHGFKEVFLAQENAREAALIEDIDIYPARNFKDIINHLSENAPLGTRLEKAPKTSLSISTENPRYPDFADIVGQENVKRALEIAATGRHIVAMCGPPGVGKTMLAKAFPGILPPLTYEEALEVTAIHSIAKTLRGEILTTPPFRSPHHTSSYASIIGGGNYSHPGEITLAHRGVLFLDEFPEFDRRVIDSLRQPLEERAISVTRAKGSITYPANCIVIIAMNPCPCGQLFENKKCICTPNEIARYRKRISGPIADRIDIWVSVPKVKYEVMSKIETSDIKVGGQTSSNIQKRVIEAINFRINNSMGLHLSKEVQSILVDFAEKLNLSARGYRKTLNVARTIADLDHSPEIKKSHLLEALQYRQRD